MSTVGAGLIVWQESRYLPLVLEQLERVPGPQFVLHCDEPLFWCGDGAPPSGFDSGVTDILRAFPHIPSFQLPKNNGAAEVDLRNRVTATLREKGAEQCFWLDADHIYDLGEWDWLMDEMRLVQPQCWTVNGRHFWRTWGTLYSKGNFRWGYPAAATWRESGFGEALENNASHCPVMCWHPSYALTDAEIYRKVSAFFHAPYFKETDFYRKWMDKSADAEQKLEPLDIPIPDSIQKRLDKWRALDGIRHK